MENAKAFKGSLNPSHIFDVLAYRKEFRRQHPEYFDPDGILVFCGAQGQGKTISAVSYVLRLIRQYPQVVICSNVAIQDQEDFIFVTCDDLEWGRVQQWLGQKETGKRVVILIPYDSYARLQEVRNGYAGVIFLIDEMHLEFNSLESKQMDSSIFYTVSQQRKQRIHIVGTAQVFTRLAKPFREQFKYAVLCRCFFRVFQMNQLVDALNAKEEDGHISAPSVRSFFWFHTSKLYESYDTLQVIKRTRDEWQQGR
jgi:hypothetical protein